MGRHDSWVSEVDDDQLAALRRLRAAFGPIEVVKVLSHDPAAIQGERLNDAADEGEPGADDELPGTNRL
jgi:hypothetical protein